VPLQHILYYVIFGKRFTRRKTFASPIGPDAESTSVGSGLQDTGRVIWRGEQLFPDPRILFLSDEHVKKIYFYVNSTSFI